MEYSVFTYKCRKCGITYEGTTECGQGSAQAHLTCAIHGLGYPNVNQPPVALVETHGCADGNVGLADLTGYNNKH